MTIKDLSTKEENTWCPGCLNNRILLASQKALLSLAQEKKIKIKDTVAVSGIGCHAKIYDYLNLNGFYSIHGRVLPTTLGIKAANPKLTVIGFGGDGDTYAEGTAHFIHACRYNADITMVVHDNQVFALTTGQATPTSEEGFKGGSTPFGKENATLNPIALALVSGASFVARGYALEDDYLAKLIKAGIEHKGFSFIEVLQPCITFHNLIPYFSKHTYKLEGENHNSSNFEAALKKAQEWDYELTENGRVPLGIFYQVQKPTYPLPKLPYWQVKRNPDWKKEISIFQ